MSNNDVITVEHVSKDFRIPTSIRHKVQSYFTNPFEKRKYHNFVALKDVTFRVHKGEFFSVIGPNGSGKSTLFKIVSGIYQPDTGKVRVQGTLIPFLELGVGFHPELSAIENVYLNATLLGMRRSEIPRHIDEIFDFAQLNEFREVPNKNYSSGMQVRLAFSIAIQLNSDILLLDEVLAVGDAEFQRKCYDYFDSIRGKKTIMFVSHDLNLVKRYSDRVLYLRHDHSYEIGKPNAVIGSYKVDSEKNTRR